MIRVSGIYGQPLLNEKLIYASMTTGVDNIVFDLGGVLLNHKNWDLVLRNSKIPKIYHKHIIDSITDQIHIINTHTISADRFIEQWVASQHMVSNDAQYLECLPSAFRLLMSSSTKFDYVDALLTSLKNKGYRLYYLSNWSMFGFDTMKKYNDMAFLYNFNGGIMSYEVGMDKPYLGIYKELEDQYKLDPSKTLFLDDKEKNVKAAINCGWKGILFQPNTTVMELLQMKDRR